MTIIGNPKSKCRAKAISCPAGRPETHPCAAATLAPAACADNLSRGNPGAIAALRAHGDASRLRFVAADLSDRGALLAALLGAGRPVDAVMHFAAVAYVAESTQQPLRYWHNITTNTVTLLEAMDAAGVRQLVYSSTCAVYGNAEEMPVTEETPPRPNNPYGHAKLAAEWAIRHYAASNKAFSAAILR